MSTITFDYRAPSGTETDSPLVGELTARLLHREVVDSAFRVIAKVIIPLVDGVATADLSDTDPYTQCWVFEEKAGIPGRRTYYKAVDGDAAFVDLVDVDPDSLQPVNELPSFKRELEDEIASRISGDAGLANDIAVEEAARVAEDAALNTAVDLKAPIASPTFTGTVTGVSKSMVGLGNVDNTTDAGKPVSTAQQAALDLKAPIASPTFTGTVSGITKSMVGLGNVDNTSDANKPVSTAQQTALDLKAPIASPTFTGTVSGVSKSMVGLGNVDNTTDAGKPISTATQTALDLKAPLASPTFTGTVAGITKSMVGLGSVDNTTDAGKPVSTAQQTALNLKANIASPTFTGTVAGITKSMVGLGSVDNTTDAGKPVSTAQQAALDLKLAITAVRSPKGVTGRAYGFVAAVLRNTGSGWNVIADATHRSQNVDSVTSDTTKITVDYTSLNFSRNVSFIAVPDETLAAAGFFIGSSVGINNTEITLARYRRVNDYISWNGSNFTSANGFFTVTSYTSGVLELAMVTNMSGPSNAFPIALTGRAHSGTNYIPVLSNDTGPLSSSTVKIEFRDYAGTLATTGNTGMKVYIDRGSNVTVADPSTVTTSAFPNSNIWIFGVFEE